eukprot:gb/GEZN01010985.1/.p1 GENE.gb/GEZN01010985.1/~~gb/GEZN01010985.1/.p1  ORF type:complete len:302 (+),score=29.12 gb/GEZN01010985.1/:116-1021(+)
MWRGVTDEATGGFCAGVVGTVIGFPLDTIKTRMQTSHSRLSTYAPLSSSPPGLFSLGRTILREEGLRGMYKGVAAPLVSLTLLNTLNFSSYGFFRVYFGASHGFDIRNGLAGACAGPIAALISTPEHMLKTQMQLDNVGARRYHGSLHAARCLIREHGFRSLYLAHGINTAREGVFLATYFLGYETLSYSLHTHLGFPSLFAVPFAGGLSGALGWLVSFPLDCIKAGVQGQRLDQVKLREIEQVAVARKLLADPGKLYAGLTPSLLRAFLVSGSRFSAYELAIWSLTSYRKRVGLIDGEGQ